MEPSGNAGGPDRLLRAEATNLPATAPTARAATAPMGSPLRNCLLEKRIFVPLRLSISTCLRCGSHMRNGGRCLGRHQLYPRGPSAGNISPGGPGANRASAANPSEATARAKTTAGRGLRYLSRPPLSRRALPPGGTQHGPEQQACHDASNGAEGQVVGEGLNYSHQQELFGQGQCLGVHDDEAILGSVGRGTGYEAAPRM